MDSFRLNGAEEMPMDLFQMALEECAEEAQKTNNEVLENFFVNIETTHIMSMDVESKQLDNRPTLLIMAGPNGSGKTTIMTHLAKHGWLKGMVYQNQDFIAQNLFGGWNDDSAIRKSAAYCEEEREALYQTRQVSRLSRDLHFCMHLLAYCSGQPCCHSRDERRTQYPAQNGYLAVHGVAAQQSRSCACGRCKLYL